MRWVYTDAASLELLLDFEKKLEAKSKLSWEIFDTLIHALSWYNREDHDDKIKDRLPHHKLSEMLQVILVFLDKSPKLHYKYRGLILNIIHAGDDIKASLNTSASIMPEWFRITTAESISGIPSSQNRRWENWELFIESGANCIIDFYKNIAEKVQDHQLFTQFRIEAEKLYSKHIWSLEKLKYLGNIADKVKNLQAFEVIFQRIVPVVGLEGIAHLIAIPKDFQEFENYYERVITQLAVWDTNYVSLLGHIQNISELHEALDFLETLLNDPRMQKCIQYHQSKNTRYARISLEPLKKIKEMYLNKNTAQPKELTGHYIDDLIQLYILNLVNNNIYGLRSGIASKKIRWEFDEFTEYVPSGERALDWTTDSEKTRKYWNWQKAANSEETRLREVLTPYLCRIFIELECTDYDLLINLLPGYIGMQEFTKIVRIPSDWEVYVIVEEGYQRHVGFYDINIEVARPKAFVERAFTFERPDLQQAIELLDNTDKVHEAIQAYKNSYQHLTS